MSVLARILEAKREEIRALKETWDSHVTVRRPTLDVARTLARPRGEPLRLIAEVKLKSPSAGALSRALKPEARARAYGEAGATMVSVLCDGTFFDGSWDHVSLARAELDRVRREVPLLAKEFVLDEVQLAVARAKGADAVLIIARIVDPARLEELVRGAIERGLEPLVEVANEEELAAALRTRARVIGVNARDLDTLDLDPARAMELVASIPSGRVAVHLSGLKSADAVREVAGGRADAALVGEALMRADDPRPLLSEMVAAAGGR